METFHLIVGPDASAMAWWQMCVRALLIFVYGIALFILSRRSFRRRTPLDVIIAVILGSALSRAITGSAHLLPTMAASATLVVAHNGVAWLACHVSWVDRFVKQEDPIPLMTRGKVDQGGMLKALVTERDLKSAMREHGLHGLDQVDAAYLEPSGMISIIPRRK